MLIVILAMARSRSSLFAELLHQHGVWSFPSPPPDKNNAVPYHENPEVKRLINTRRGKIYETLKPTHIDGFMDDLIETRDRHGYNGGPWLMKVDAFCYPLFDDAEFFTLYRPEEDILNSINNTSFMIQQRYTQDQWKNIIKKHHDYMKDKGTRVNADNLRNELQPIIEGLGLEFKPEVLEIIH